MKKIKPESTLLKKTAGYSLSVYLAQIIGIVGSLLAKYFLGPFQVGIWGALQLIIDLSKYTTLGVMQSISVEIPFYNGRQEYEHAEKLKNLVFSYLMVLSFVSAAVLLLCAIILRGHISESFCWGLLGLTAILPLQRFNNYFISLLRAEKDFSTASRQVIYSAVINVILVSLLSYKFKIYGFIWATGLSLLLNIVYVLFRKRYKVSFFWNALLFLKSIKLGIPLIMISFLGQLLRSMDKIVILIFLGFEAMGLYSIAIMVSNYLSSLHTSVTVVLAPHMHEKEGQGISVGAGREFYQRSVIAMSQYLPILLGLAIILSPLVIYLFLKEFIGGIFPMQILALSIYFIALANVTSTYLVSKRKHRALVPLLSFVCILSLLLNYLAIRMGAGLEGVAIATLMTSIINYLLIYVMMTAFTETVTGNVKLISGAMFNFLYTVVIIILSTKIAGTMVANQIGQTLIATFSFLLCCSPFLYFLNRDHQIGKRMLRRLKLG